MGAITVKLKGLKQHRNSSSVYVVSVVTGTDGSTAIITWGGSAPFQLLLEKEFYCHVPLMYPPGGWWWLDMHWYKIPKFCFNLNFSFFFSFFGIWVQKSICFQVRFLTKFVYSNMWDFLFEWTNIVAVKTLRLVNQVIYPITFWIRNVIFGYVQLN